MLRIDDIHTFGVIATELQKGAKNEKSFKAVIY
jgi:hypothetical protein